MSGPLDLRHRSIVPPEPNGAHLPIGCVGRRSAVRTSAAAQIAPFGASDEVRPEDDLPSIAADIAR
jgi:hypothetical protein